MKSPIVITSLEEDFRKIGLLKAESLEAPSVAEEASEDLEEAQRIKKRLVRKAGGGVKIQKTQRTTAAERMKGKKYRRTAAGKKAARRRAKKMRTSRGKRLAARMAKLGMAKGTRQESFDQDSALKSYANAAIIADHLAKIFVEWMDNYELSAIEENTFASAATDMQEIAEAFAAIATRLNDGELIESEEDVAEVFSEGLEAILDAVDLYEMADMEDESDYEEEDEARDEEEDMEEENADPRRFPNVDADEEEEEGK